MIEREKEMEREANGFAVKLLMPERPFLEIWNDSNTVQEVADYFQVSTSVANYRAMTLLGEMMFE